MEGFEIRVEIPVAWGEMDALGHVNNIFYFRYFETARMKYFDLAGILEMMRETGIGPILAETSCRFRAPLRYPEVIFAGARVKSIGKSSFVMEYIIASDTLGTVATGTGVIIMYDYRSGVKVDVPVITRKAIEIIEKKGMPGEGGSDL